MQLPGPLLSTSSKNKKESSLKRSSYISGNGTFLPQEKLNKTYLKFLAAKNVMEKLDA